MSIESAGLKFRRAVEQEKPLQCVGATTAYHARLAEAIQTVMRRHGIEQPYEKLKQLTRGRRVAAADLAAFVDALDLPEEARLALTDLSPADYTGNARQMAAEVSRSVDESDS